MLRAPETSDLRLSLEERQSERLTEIPGREVQGSMAFSVGTVRAELPVAGINRIRSAMRLDLLVPFVLGKLECRGIAVRRQTRYKTARIWPSSYEILHTIACLMIPRAWDASYGKESEARNAGDCRPKPAQAPV